MSAGMKGSELKRSESCGFGPQPFGVPQIL